jgi:hypothetical protein
MKTIRVVSLLGSASLALLVGSSALAQTTGYPGTMCVQVMTGMSTASIFYEGVITRNQATSSKSFLCNAIQSGGAISAWRVSVRDTTPSGEIVCSARASGEFDSSGFISPSASSGVSFFGNKTLGVGVAGTSSFVANGSKNVVCTMPASFLPEGSAVASYSITES